MASRGPYRTSIPVMFLRGCVFIGGPIYLFLSLFMGTSAALMPATIATLILWGSIALVMSVAGWIIGIYYGNFCPHDTNWWAFTYSGGSVWWDATCPWPINPDCQAVRDGGLPEPKTSWVPPPSYKFQCPFCGARNLEQYCVCWNCDADCTDPDGNIAGNDDTYVGVESPTDIVIPPSQRSWTQEEVREAKRGKKKRRTSERDVPPERSDTIPM